MRWIDNYESRAIELALKRLREDGIVLQDASVDDDAPESRKRRGRQEDQLSLRSEPERKGSSPVLRTRIA